MTAKQCSFVAIGLPGTGKTTYLAALWHSVLSNDIPGSLGLKELHGDRTYLNSIREKWLKYQEVGRTALGADVMTSMKLCMPGQEGHVEVFFPDISGELSELHWRERRWSADHATLVSSATGFLLFLHPDKIVDNPPIALADRVLAGLSEHSEDNTAGQHEEVKAWDPTLAPTQVVLVDLLQFLALRRQGSFKLAIVVSAWDLVAAQGISPREWVALQLPLLMQYLTANSERIASMIYGVSAQGGALPTAKAELRAVHPETHRIKVIAESREPSHNITAPMQWIMQ